MANAGTFTVIVVPRSLTVKSVVEKPDEPAVELKRTRNVPVKPIPVSVIVSPGKPEVIESGSMTGGGFVTTTKLRLV